MKKINCDVVIVDSGITEKCYKENCNKIIGYKSFGDDDTYIDRHGHGTAIFSRITENINVSVFIIKLFNEVLEVDEQTFIDVLRYIDQNINCKIINMSLGLIQCDHKQIIEDICLKITQGGALIVSAFNNAGAVSYPAAFPFVLGVDVSNECTKKDEYIIVENSMIDIMGFSKIQRVKWLDNVPFAFVSGSSFATANITHCIISHMVESKQEYVDHSMAKKVLSPRAIKTIVYHKGDIIQYPLIKKAIVFPLNKEITSLINYSELLTFDLIGVYDFRVTGNVNKEIHSIYGNKTFVIKDVDLIDWKDDIDTVIVGHIHEIEKVLNRDIINEFIDLCSKYNKKIVCFDCFEDELVFGKSNVYYTPHITNKYLNFQNGKLALINTPVLGIWGTSSHQGKYTLQLFLRKAFLNAGYKIAQISTEPSGFLFGMDSIIPMGYNSSINMNFRETICYINQEISRLESKNPDIILVGAQSNTSVYFPGNIAQYPTAQIELLLGTMPDAVILCVNSFDDQEYIQRTIDAIESISYSKVIALGLYPLTKQSNDILHKRKMISETELASIKTKLSNIFSKPVFIVGNEYEMNCIYQFVIDWFSGESR